MKNITRIIVASVTLSVASLAAVSIVSAHPGGGYGMGPGMGIGGSRPRRARPSTPPCWRRGRIRRPALTTMPGTRP